LRSISVRRHAVKIYKAENRAKLNYFIIIYVARELGFRLFRVFGQVWLPVGLRRIVQIRFNGLEVNERGLFFQLVC
jgi:hypothetical protein